ncbi:MAG: damage-control phosphatase ARMT1 family protein [Chloroflexota bacterium]|nr:damage-control phosphatase ARMT1 family protein [Chloroflexota bacterium]
MTSPAKPPFIMTSEEGSFARFTIEERKPMIIDRILDCFDYPPVIHEALLAFKTEMKEGTIQPLQEITNDREIWDHDMQPWLDKPWLEIPWFLAETYFYRRVLEAVQYFQPGPWQGLNPYQRLKDRETRTAMAIFTPIYDQMAPALSLSSFRDAITKALWGNRTDLSNLQSFEHDMSNQSERIIRDDSAAVFAFLKDRPRKIAYIFDNVGKELYFDLALVDQLLRHNLAANVTFYLKNQPYFVSDAMPDDLEAVLGQLAASDAKKDRALASRLRKNIRTGRIQIETPPFFTTGRMYRQMPAILSKQIGERDLAILKGDVNYRRLVGDRHWPPTTLIGAAAGHFPTAFVSLRTMKAELVVGLTVDQVADLDANAEPDWQINGKRGMITYLEK